MMHAISKEMFCVGVAVASCCATVRVLGANYAFPSAGGDISSAEAWNGILPSGVSIPGEADSIDISQPSDKYKITQDVTFGNIRFTGGSGLYLVDVTGWDVNFTTNVNALYTYTSANENKRHIALKGGCWDLNGSVWLGIDSHNTFELRDSCILTNISTCWATMWQQSDAHLSLKNDSSIFCEEFRVGNKNFSGTVDVNDGSKIIVKNNFYTDTDGAVTDVLNCHTTVSGEGSLIEAKNILLGYKTSGNYIKVCDGATIRCVDFVINSSKGNDNRLVLNNNAALDVTGSIWLKDGAARGSKSGIAATNSSISVSAFTNSCQSAYLDFQNVKFECNGEFHPFYYGRYGTVRFGGSNGNLPSFMKNLVKIFGSVPIGHTLMIDDGFVWESSVNTKEMMRVTSNCTVRVSNGARLAFSGEFFLGHTDFDNQCLDNVVEIVDGGVMTARRFYIAGSGNTLVVRNGTLRLTDESEGLGVGYKHNNNAKYTPNGAKVVISGATPKIEAAGNCYLRQDSILKFEIPAQGYAEGYVPFEGLRLFFDNTASIEVDCEDYLAAGGGVLTLMKFKGLPKWDNVEALLAQWLQAQSEAMPLPRCSLKYVVKDDETHPHHILLRALPPMGLRMVIR